MWLGHINDVQVMSNGTYEFQTFFETPTNKKPLNVLVSLGNVTYLSESDDIRRVA